MTKGTLIQVRDFIKFIEDDIVWQEESPSLKYTNKTLKALNELIDAVPDEPKRSEYNWEFEYDVEHQKLADECLKLLTESVRGK